LFREILCDFVDRFAEKVDTEFLPTLYAVARSEG
jgi:hypothetical protein